MHPAHHPPRTAGDFCFGKSHQNHFARTLRRLRRFPRLGACLSRCSEGTSDLHGWRKCKGLSGTILAMCPRAYARLAALRFPCSRLQVQGSPSVASPFSGTKVHWTFVLIRFTPLAPLRAELRLRKTCCTGTYECRERRMQVNGLGLSRGAKKHYTTDPASRRGLVRV